MNKPEVIDMIDAPPVSLDAQRRHLRIIPDPGPTPSHPHDPDIISALEDATAFVEEYTRRSFRRKRYMVAVGARAGRCAVTLPFAAPLVSVETVEYIDPQGAVQLLPSSAYFVVLNNPSSILPKGDEGWPAMAMRPDAIRVTYVAGYVNQNTIPPNVIRAIKQVAADFFENREDSTPLNSRPVSFHATNLLQFERIYAEAAV